MTKHRSYAWENFYNEFFGRTPYEQWHDGIDDKVVLGLQGPERDEAEDLLIKSLEKDEMWPTKGLAMLKSKKALPVLKRKLQNASGVLKIRIADAIEEIELSGKYVPVIIDELLHNGSPYDRLEAAMVLKKFPTHDVVEALYKGIMDPDYLVRYHSSESLLAIHGYIPNISKFDKIFRLIISDTDKPHPSGKKPDVLHEEAVQQLKKLFKNVVEIKEITTKIELLKETMNLKGLKLSDYEQIKEEIEKLHIKLKELQ